MATNSRFAAARHFSCGSLVQTWVALRPIIWNAALIALSAQVSIPWAWSPVPLSIAPQVVCWLAWVFPATAPASVLCYLLGSGLGLPLLSRGQGGIAQLLGPRGGYLLGYLLAAHVVRALRTLWQGPAKFRLAPLLAIWIGSALILGCGYLRLVPILGFEAAWTLGVAPFLVGDFLLKGPFFAQLFRHSFRSN